MSSVNSPQLLGLVAIAHGSRDPKWRQQIEARVQPWIDQFGADRVQVAYMEINEPSLESAVATLHQHGCREITVLPLFMSSGGHVDRDIPNQVQQVQALFPDLVLSQVAPIGEQAAVTLAMGDVVDGLLSR